MKYKKNRFCVVIPARNEEKVIGGVLESLFKQDYPNDLFDVYVVPNNCNDNTETVSRKHGAYIFNCEKPVRYRGDALEQFFEYIISENDIYDAFCMFDADNIVEKDFIKKMNDVYNSGVQVAQGYKGSKNPGETWVSGCQAIYFCAWNLLYKVGDNNSKSLCITGPGNMIAAEVIKKIPFSTVTITEDIEYSCKCVLNGIAIKHVPDAIFYEEHPTTISVTWTQYRRWFSGGWACAKKYGKDLKKSNINGDSEFCNYVYTTTILSRILFFFVVVVLIVLILLISLLKINPINAIISLVFLDATVNAFSAVKFIKNSKLSISDIKKASISLYWFYTLLIIVSGAVSFIIPVHNWKQIKRSV